MPAKPPQPPVVVVHAITGSVLLDYYNLPPGVVWDPSIGLTHLPTRDFLRITSHPEDLRYEAIEPAMVKASHPIQLIYGDLVEALRYELSPTHSEHTPVFVFAYDWRRNNDETAQLLEAFIVEVIERTNLLKRYRRKCTQVDLVAHSMGGLVVTSLFAQRRHRNESASRVRRVVTLGTPFRGSVDALEKLTTGESEIVGSSSNREREAARMTPAIYELLPAFPEGFVDEKDKPLDVFDSANWQDSIKASLTAFIDLYSTGRKTDADGLLKRMLDRAKAAHEAMRDLKPEDDLEPVNGLPGWLHIVGIGSDTRGKAVFDEKRIQEFENEPKERSGDGTVPLRGALAPWVMPKPERVVCFSKDAFGFGEVRDRGLAAVIGLHATLPTMNVIQRWVVSFLKGEESGSLEAAGPFPGVPLEDWKPPFKTKKLRDALAKSRRAKPRKQP